MAYPLQSPGVHVSVIDESFYPSAGAGTVPLIFIATHEFKAHSSGTGIAEGSLPENANKLYYLSSQRELIQTFGNPIFYTSGGTPLHGYELNEYGLHAAYQYLAMTSSCFVIRAPIDLGQLLPRSLPPRGEPLSGTYWLDTAKSSWGVFESNGNSVAGLAWQSRSAIRIESDADIEVAIYGKVGFTNMSDEAITTSGVISINGTLITIAANSTLQQVIDQINAKGLSVQAFSYRLGEKNYIILKNLQPGGQITIDNATTIDLSKLGLDNGVSRAAPKNTIGSDGQFAIVLRYNDNCIYQKIKAQGILADSDVLSSSQWFLVGTDEWKKARPTRIVGLSTPGTITSGNSFNISNGTENVTVSITGTTVDDVVSNINNAISALPASSTLKTIVAGKPGTALVLADINGGNIALANVTGTPLASLGVASKNGNKMNYGPHYRIPAGSVTGDVWVKTTKFHDGANWILKVYDDSTGVWENLNPPVFGDDSEANAYFGSSKVPGTTYVKYNIYGTTDNPVGSHTILRWTGVAWEEVSYEALNTEPTTEPENGTMWYSSNFRADVMVCSGSKWVGYANYTGNVGTDPNGVIFSGSRPTKQSTGAPLVDNDLWCDTSDLENYPKLYRYSVYQRDWLAIDTSDQITPFGIVFGDARWSANGEHAGPQDMFSMLQSDFVDPDAPDPRVYPEGMLLWNTRYSTYNVKQWEPSWLRGGFRADPNGAGVDYFLTGYNVGNATFPALVDTGRWVTVSGNMEDGRPYSGRKAQRIMVVRGLQAAVVSNEDARSETIFFNLMAAPGYPELIDDLIALNTDKHETAFIIGDVPCRLDPSPTSLLNWTNPTLSSASGTTEDYISPAANNPYVGLWYPWGLSTNIDGTEIMIPSSSIALRTLAYSDNISYPWFAPAGFTRGLVTNASTVGFLQKNGEFKVTLLNSGQRDVLYQNRINPIAYVANRGLISFGQKTRHTVDSALDRIHVARLMNYLRYNFDLISKPFLFEPNDPQTRDAIKSVYERFLSDMVGKRALYDYIVVCDDTNNSAERIDRAELWIDIAVQPVKALEYIYIPVRLVNTGTNMQSLYNPRRTFS